MSTKSFKVTANSYINEVFVPNTYSRVVFRTHHFENDHHEIDAHPDYWSLALFNIKNHEAGVALNKKDLQFFNGSIAIFLPRFSIVEWVLKKGTLHWVYYMSRSPLPEELKLHSRAILNVNFDEVFELITRPSENIQNWTLNQSYINIDRNFLDHIVPEKLKKSIDQSFRSSLPLSHILEDLKYSPAMASRLFKKKFGITPSEYRSQLRMKQASVDLLFEDQNVEDVQWNVGIKDSSYFYKSFKRYINGHPSHFRLPRHENQL